ncbi:uncharacterized protein CcaverHIS019_0406520 [Cutaneotrichosporon cavernicola]|uniref:Large ribosomal subunit protein uL3m n=1 Tax=Cutaneotrichosporon cavernicola TaxID=279322 RepID=A0AA48QW57_9TREE|nr:uncharacterized protein CcaverHIS019_0406520 [Cutaneotrichosporon cavernicola]BEI91832.1 hypothetical protein CcaverHIS019_0406520 [Cutaneotrichosporon cavernicola]BEI99604.1 hypothetical protein CcaverHIS631_0406470 [Cutaneotrichosporon cavernicola]BEJ07380.1 hypothetical protein CcaverHIS641_0406490 [Cutaneotrichosporon cavernicola]
MRSLLSALPALPALRRPLARSLATAAEPVSSSASSDAAEPSAPWTPFTQRTGVIARKRGMTSLWDKNGKRWPVTVLQLDNCEVVRVTPPPENDPKQLHSLQLGSTDRREKNINNAMKGYFRAHGVNPKRKLQEFRVSKEAVLPVGTQLGASHFVPGQYVDVTATSIGKGFQGAMKRHGYHGLKASHGVSVTHRSAGSTGSNQDPGRVLPGKKMAGHMGNVKRTTQNLLVHRVDLALNLVFVRGAVPGVDDAFVSVRDAKKMVAYKAQNNLMAGKPAEEWLPEGVKALPVPAGTVERQTSEGWPEIIQWQGKA